MADISNRPVESLSFEEAMDELEELAAMMASGNVPLEESVRAYERGAALLKRCRGALAQAEQTIARLKKETAEDEAAAADAAERLNGGDIPF